MPQFEYTATNGNQVQKGTINAPDQFTAYKILKENGFSNITWSMGKSSLSLLSRKPSTEEFYIYFEELAAFLDVRMPLDMALNCVEKVTENKILKKVTNNIRTEIKEGTNIDEAFEKQNIFPKVAINLIKLGNLTSGLHERAATIAEELRQQHAMNGKFQKALRMPAFILVLAISFIFVINKFVIPIYQKIYSENKAELPLLTKMLFNFSNFLHEYWTLILLTLVLSCYFMLKFVNKNPEKVEKLLLKIPFVNKLFKGYIMYSFSSNLHSLLEAGVKLQEAVKLLPSITSSRLMQELLKRSYELVKEGIPLSKALKEKDHLNIMNTDVLSLLEAGEGSTQVKELMKKTAKNYFSKNDDRLTKYIDNAEPTLVLMFASIFGLVLFAVQAPYFNLMKVIIKH